MTGGFGKPISTPQSSVQRGIRKAPKIVITSSDGSVNGVTRKVEQDSSRESSTVGSSLLKLVPVQMQEVDLQLTDKSNKKSNYLIDERSKQKEQESYQKTETDIDSILTSRVPSEESKEETKGQFVTRMRVITTEAVK